MMMIKDYIIYYRNLKLYWQLGLKLKKIQQILQFDQKPFLMPYVDFNTAQRAQAENERNFFKLMNNACFGKTMENVRNRIDFHSLLQWKILTEKKQILDMIAK